MKIIPKNKKCDFTACRKIANELVYKRGFGIGMYCESHADIVVDQELANAEYITDCPNCGCKFTVN